MAVRAVRSAPHGSATFGPGDLGQTILTSAGGIDAYVWKLSQGGPPVPAVSERALLALTFLLLTILTALALWRGRAAA